MIQTEFAERVVEALKDDASVIGLAAGGSWITGELDEWSDLDLVLVTREKVSHDPGLMREYAQRFGLLLSAFTGEHVGESRLLICLYDEPLLHVDIKFLTTSELKDRVEDPVVLLDRNDELAMLFSSTQPSWPQTDAQWIEDRFWIWIHYATQKLGRGEYFEAIDFLAFLRATVLAPLLQLSKAQNARGMRRVEETFTQQELRQLVATLSTYDAPSIIRSLNTCIDIYRKLRTQVFPENINYRTAAEERAVAYLGHVEQLVGNIAIPRLSGL
jgi:predicted nucleotidyltransferase